MQFTKALITGASSGIGEALCHLLAQQGIELCLTGRDEKRLQHLQADLQHRVPTSYFVADIATPEGRQKVSACIGEFVPDLLINNAGFGLYGDALTYDSDVQAEIVQVNVVAALEFMLAAGRSLISCQKKGVILNVSSSAAFEILPSFAVYTASKAFINSCSQSLDFEMRPYGVRVLAACPGMVKTAFADRAAGGEVLSRDQDEISMSPAFAAQAIWKQIRQAKPLHIFDWRYQLMVGISRFIPKKWVAWFFKKSIEKRYPKRAFKPGPKG